MNCIYLYNPNSGKSKYKNKQDYIISRLHQKFDVVDYFPTTSKEDAMARAKDACGYYDAIIFSGGDGTVNDIVNAIASEEKRPILGYLPSGTCNDFASSLNIPNNLDKALDVIINGTPCLYDVFNANGRYGVYVCACGIFTTASYSTEQSKKRKLGKIAYYFHSVKEVFTCKSSDYTIEFDNGTQRSGKSVLLLLMNSKSVAGYKLNKMVDLHDGEMEFLAVTTKKNKLTLKALLVIFGTFLFGVKFAKKRKCVQYYKFKSCNLKFTSNNPVLNIDGENGGVNDCQLAVCANHLQVFTCPNPNAKPNN